jgi:hypothetical protein
MSEAVLVALITGGMPCIAILIKGIVDWGVSQRAAAQVAKVAATAQATHTIVNSQRTEMMDKIDTLTKEVAQLKRDRDG